MTTFLVLLLTVVAVVGAAYPLLKRKPSLATGDTGDENLEELQSHRDTTYSMLKELEFDYHSGILSQEDYEALRNRYKRKAVNILKDMDSLQEGTGTDDEIERKVLARRQKAGNLSPESGAVDEIERKVQVLRQRAGNLSPDHGAADEIEEKVLALRRKGQFCPQCGARHEPNDLFCIQCGTKLFKERGS